MRRPFPLVSSSGLLTFDHSLMWSCSCAKGMWWTAGENLHCTAYPGEPQPPAPVQPAAAPGAVPGAPGPHVALLSAAEDSAEAQPAADSSDHAPGALPAQALDGELSSNQPQLTPSKLHRGCNCVSGCAMTLRGFLNNGQDLRNSIGQPCLFLKSRSLLTTADKSSRGS